MSRKYLILAEVGGKIRFLWIRSNGCQKGIEGQARQMVGKLFARQKIVDLWFMPWPLDQFTIPPNTSWLSQAVLDRTGKRDFIRG